MKANIDLYREFGDYRKACYGNRGLPLDQCREVEQAFLSGIMVGATMASSDNAVLNEITSVVRERLQQMDCFPPGF